MPRKLTHVRVPLVEPFRISSGAVAEKDGIVVAVRNEGNGIWRVLADVRLLLLLRYARKLLAVTA